MKKITKGKKENREKHLTKVITTYLSGNVDGINERAELVHVFICLAKPIKVRLDAVKLFFETRQGLWSEHGEGVERGEAGEDRGGM